MVTIEGFIYCGRFLYLGVTSPGVAWKGMVRSGTAGKVWQGDVFFLFSF